MGKDGIILPFWERFMDDILAVVKKYDVTFVLESLNNIDKKIAFPMETEMDHSLPWMSK